MSVQQWATSLGGVQLYIMENIKSVSVSVFPQLGNLKLLSLKGWSHWWTLQYIVCWAAHKNLRSACFSQNEIILVCLNLQILSGLATACVRYLWVVKNDKSKDKLIIRNIIILSLYLSIFFIYLLHDSNLYFKCRYEWEYYPFWDFNNITNECGSMKLPVLLNKFLYFWTCLLFD